MGNEPILPGFFPDPSICRVGDEFFVANSTFEYVPGIPIHSSRDLLTWELVGHAVTDPTEVAAPEGAAGASAGLFAPTLRYHDGVFWLTTTTIGRIGEGQLITHASDPAGPWSTPVRVPDTVGIDPDLAWDDDGRCLLTWRSMSPPGIMQIEIDPATGERFGEPRTLWAGGDLADTEGPHVIRRGAWWYLVVAEGGTHTGHGVSVARSRDPRGPFEQHPHNPIFSHRSTGHPVQATGHADLVECADGSWAVVFLGIRQNGSFPAFHVNGRETFLAGVDWVGDWPVVVEERFAQPADPAGFADRFDGLDPRWVSPSVAPETFARADGSLALAAGRDAASPEQTHVLCARVTAREWDAAAEMADGDTCLSVRIDGAHWYGAEVVGGRIRARAVSDPFDAILAESELPDGARPALRARTADGFHAGGVGPDTIEIGWDLGGAFTSIAAVDGRYVSTEVAGGFTGRMIGVEALGSAARVAEVAFRPHA
ncbi:glycoside hydrolase family 43 protein [Microbacterium karelineae]|uniref:glycoside hydrolase family 43 protein n=1 Tax=Microbacterium karelineae TaxID=2654283 RepID=UPI0012E9FAB8|nr:glycoside hydrolase family 43 protein [Microbacterium karelineae]